jgi:DNA-binding MarR family transcriptional regulator
MFYKNEDLVFFKPSPKLRELMILSYIEKSSKISQKELSKHLEISPAMINKYITKFIEKEFIITKGKTNRTIRYFLTEKGKEEKDRLVFKYMIETVKLYKDAKKEFQEKIKKFKEENIDKVVFYGAAETAEISILAALEIGLKVVAVIDKDAEKQGKTLGGVLIVSPDMLTNIDFDGVIISSMGFSDEIYKDVVKKVKDKKILKL